MGSHRKPYSPISPFYTAVALAALGFTGMVTLSGGSDNTATRASQTAAEPPPPAPSASPRPRTKAPLITGGVQIPTLGSPPQRQQPAPASPTSATPGPHETASIGYTTAVMTRDGSTASVVSLTTPASVSPVLPSAAPSPISTTPVPLASTSSAATETSEPDHGGRAHGRPVPAYRPTPAPTIVPITHPGRAPYPLPTAIPARVPATGGGHWPIVMKKPAPLRSLLPLLPSIFTSHATRHHRRGH